MDPSILVVKYIYYQLYYTQITDKMVTLPTKQKEQGTVHPFSINNETWANVTLKFY